MGGFMSKEVVSKKNKALAISQLTREERAILDRKASHTTLTNAVSELPEYIDEKGELKKPNKEMLVRSFYKRIKDRFEMSCEEIDASGNVMMCNAVRALREDGEYIISQWFSCIVKFLKTQKRNCTLLRLVLQRLSILA